ncbi:MAG: HAMP domain-containing protein, partial [Deltaproteobacteria bacterium]|nr:HAMP domain-containing protein [Deltaproteobacteria bacterium]
MALLTQGAKREPDIDEPALDPRYAPTVIRFMGRTERRVILALLVTGILPLVTAMWFANRVITGVSSTAFQPEFEDHLDRSLLVYADLVKSMKQAMRAEGAAIAADHALQVAAAQDDGAAVSRELQRVMKAHPRVQSIEVENADGDVLGSQHRDDPIDETRLRPFSVRKPLGEGDEAPAMIAIFAAERARLDEMAAAQEFAQAYKTMSKKHRGAYVERPHLTAAAVLFGFTVLLAFFTGILVVRPLIRRIHRLAEATQPVAQGDLSVRVAVTGRDEIADLATAFNRMLEELGLSRARIEFLKRIGEWQQMARRLAHEIKNPLTPIQLAVEECHRRYDGDNESYQTLLATTLDIVVEEVASLRRLVSEFSEFARLPRAALGEGDLSEFLREQEPRLGPVAEDAGEAVTFAIEVDPEPAPVALDRTMLHRVLSNLVANAAQATAGDEGEGSGQVKLTMAQDGDHWVVDVEDDGPGISPQMRQTIFTPYMTTKREGTGLGLTIVKKVVIDHGGSIEVDRSPLGGARFRLRLPSWGTPASEEALARS